MLLSWSYPRSNTLSRKPFQMTITIITIIIINTASLTHSLTHSLTNSLAPRSRLLPENPDSHPVEKFPAIYVTQSFIITFTSTQHLPLSWFSLIHSIPPHPTSHLLLGLPSGLFHSGFPTKTLYTPLLSPIRTTCPVHLILLDFITRTILGEEYRSLSSSLCTFLHSPVTFTS